MIRIDINLVHLGQFVKNLQDVIRLVTKFKLELNEQGRIHKTSWSMTVWTTVEMQVHSLGTRHIHGDFRIFIQGN